MSTQDKQNIMDFSYELFKESMEPLIQYKGLHNLHLIIGYPPFLRDASGNFMPLTLEMEDDNGNTHTFRFNPITPQWFQDFLQKMFMEYFNLSEAETKQSIKLYLSGERTQQIFHLQSGTLIYLRMDAGFTGSGMVLTAVPRYETKYAIPSKVINIGKALPGLVLFTGAYGSDRAYTMYSMLLAVLHEKSRKVSIVEQVPRYNLDFISNSLIMRRIAFDPQQTYFAEMLRALTTDVDIICLDDASDPNAFETALKVCAAGKTVFAMIGAASIQEAIDSILLRYDPKKREMIRYQLSISLRGIIYQQLVPAVPTLKEARIPAFEAACGDRLSSFIATYEPGKGNLRAIINTNADVMLPLSQSLDELRAHNLITDKTRQMFNPNAAYAF